MSLDSDTTRRAITAVRHPDFDTARKWFELIGTAYESIAAGASAPDDVPVADFRSVFDSTAQSAAGSEAVDGFWRYLEDNQSQRSVMTVIADLATPGDLGDILRIYAEAWPEQTAESEVDAAPEQDPGVLLGEVVARFGADWAGWDGSEEGWGQYRDWLYNATNHVDPAWYAAIYEYLNPLDSMTVPDRIAYLSSWGFTVSGAEAAPEPFQDAAPEAFRDEVPDEARDGVEDQVQDAAVVEEVVSDFVEQAMANIINDLPAIAAELEMTEDELRALIAEQPPEFLAENILGAIDG